MIRVKLKDLLKDINGLEKSIELEFTNMCNAVCLICPRDEIERPKGYMSSETMEIVLEACKQYGINNISIGGFGETFLHKNFQHLIRRLRKELPETKLSITTNGLLFTPKIQEFLVEVGMPEINVSFHSYTAEEYQKMMGISYQKVIENIQHFVRQYPLELKNLRIGIVRNKLNNHLVEDMICFWKEIGIKYFTILTAHNRAEQLGDNSLIDADFYHKNGVEINEEDNLLCQKASAVLKFVDWEGKVHICCNDLKNLGIMGHLSEEGFDSIENRRSLIWKKTQSDLCSGCNMPSTLLNAEIIAF